MRQRANQGDMMIAGSIAMAEVVWIFCQWIKAKWNKTPKCSKCGHHLFWHEGSQTMKMCQRRGCLCLLTDEHLIDRNDVPHLLSYDPVRVSQSKNSRLEGLPGQMYRDSKMPSPQEVTEMIVERLMNAGLNRDSAEKLAPAIRFDFESDGLVNLNWGKPNLNQGGDRPAQLSYDPELADRYDEIERQMETEGYERDKAVLALVDAGYTPILDITKGDGWSVSRTGEVRYCKVIPSPEFIGDARKKVIRVYGFDPMELSSEDTV